MKFTLGLEQLDKMLRPMLDLNSLIVVAGHPGAGKTSFSLKVCYENALKGNKCVYFTFQEDKRKLYTIMKNLGIDLEDIEKKGLFKFVRIPVILGQVDDLLKIINNVLTEFQPKILIIDSINVLLKSIEDEKKRGYLQNYFYTLPTVIDGLVVLIAELPFGREQLELGDVEFVADAIFILKHSIEDGLLVRSLEIRKARGAPILEAELPFTITEGRGIRLLASPIIEEIPRFDETVKFPCRIIDEVVGEVSISSTIYITYPLELRPAFMFPIILGLSILNNKKMLMVSYRYSSKVFPDLLKSALSRLGYNLSTEIRRQILKNVDFVGLNPYAFSISELYQKEIELALRKDYDIVVFHGVELLESLHPARYLRSLVNQLLYFKSQGKLVLRMSSYINEHMYKINATVSDIVFKFEFLPYSESINRKDYKLLVWRMGREPQYLSREELETCVRESAWNIIQRVT